MEKKQTSVHPHSSVNLKRQDMKAILYDTIELPWGQHQQYTVSHKIGRGRYSHVFQGRDTKTNKTVAVKVLLPVKPTKIKREYHFLKVLQHPNIIKLVDVVKCSHLRTASLVMQHFPHVDFRQLYPTLTLPDIKHYTKQLFETLDYIHSNGIMHRDIKPFNVLINPQNRQLKVIDFGLSEYYFPSKENNTKVASTYYKAPELYFSNSQYDYRVDCWAVGMILAGMIFKKTPFLMGNDQIDQILKLTKLIGANEVVSYIKEYKLSERRGHRRDNICFDIIVAYENGDIKAEDPSDFEEFVNKSNEANATGQALDLIKHLLKLDYVTLEQFREKDSQLDRLFNTPFLMMFDLHNLPLQKLIYLLSPSLQDQHKGALERQVKLCKYFQIKKQVEYKLMNDNNLKFKNLQEVRLYAQKTQKILLLHKDKILDVTTFSSNHPGGGVLLQRQQLADISSHLEYHHPLSVTLADTMTIASFKEELQPDIDPNLPVGPQIWKADHQTYLKLLKSPHWLFVQSPRLFTSDIVQTLSHNKWYVVPIVPCMIIAYYCNNVTSWDTFNIFTFILAAIGGSLIFSLVEYALHRFIFHSESHLPDNRLMRYLHFFTHGVHHMLPNDPDRLVLPVPLFLVIYFLTVDVVLKTFIVFKDPVIYATVWSFFLVGYTIYDISHYAMHHVDTSKQKGSWFHKIQRYHNRHHFSGQEAGFGVSTPLWDIILGSGFKKSKSK